MSHIDQIITEANLRDVKVYHFDTMLDGIDLDIDNFRKLVKRNQIDDKSANSTLTALISKQAQLQTLAREWVEAVGLHSYRANRIVILIEQMPES
jgi:Tfp pilus assembly protein FimT